jgi:F-type H+-transporting ATPase subunit epsilon
MAKEFLLSVVAPDRTVVEQSVVSLVAPGADGYIGVLADHIPVIVALRPGVLEYRDPSGQTKHVSIGGGFLEVSGGQAIVLADGAALASEIDLREEEDRMERARRTLRGESSDMTTEQATHELELAVSRIRAARRG